MPNTVHDPDNLFFARSINPFGTTWESWSIAWWKWLMLNPKTTNPANDSDGSNAGGGPAGTLSGQNPPVYFLAGTSVPFPFKQEKDRAVRGSPAAPLPIPTANFRAIFFPLTADLETAIERPAQPALDRLATDDMDRMESLELTIDDDIDFPTVSRRDSLSLKTGFLSQFRVRTQDSPTNIFNIAIAPLDLFDLNPGPGNKNTTAGADGFYAFIIIDRMLGADALPLGPHKIHFKSVEDDYSTNVTYYLNLT